MAKRKDIAEKDKWDLSSLIKSPDEYISLGAEIDLLTSKIVGMKGHITGSSAELYTYLKSSALLDEKLERIYVYSYLYFYQDMQDETGLKYKNKADELINDVGIKLSFTSSELLQAGYEKIKKYLEENPDLEKYRFYLEKTFRYEKHVLSAEEEKIIAASLKAFGTPSDAYQALDNVDINLGYIKDENNKKISLTSSNYIKYMNSKNRRIRKEAFKKMYEFYKNHINTIATLYLGQIKEGFFLSETRGFNSPLEQSLFGDKIKPDFYADFISEIHGYLPLLYKYFRLRNKILGYKNHMYDIYVDLSTLPDEDIPYDTGKTYIIEALKPLKEKYIEDLKQAFTDGWIDIYPNDYKRSGAYQWGSYKVHPYVSINYENNADSVSTLVHELGHAMHSYYSDQNQDFIYAGYPIFLAEIASTVNEVLMDDYFYRKAQTKEEKIVYLQSFLDKVRTTIFRQTMFAEFEMIIHDKYARKEAITSQELCETYYELNTLYFGKNVVSDEEIKYEWARIPHLYTPFYVYKYATGLISALSIASDILNGNDDKIDSYLEFLKSGGNGYPLEILKKASVDIEDPRTIRKAFKLFEEKLNLLEELIAKDDENE